MNWGHELGSDPNFQESKVLRWVKAETDAGLMPLVKSRAYRSTLDYFL